METTSMTSTFIAASGRDVKVENCVSNKKSAFAKAAARQPSPFFFAGSPSLSRHSRAKAGDPGLIRTADLRFRKPMLYPSELRGHVLDFTRSAQKMAYCSGLLGGRSLGDRPRATRIEPKHDSQTQIRRISTVFEKEKCQDGQAPQPGHLLDFGKSKAARTRSTVLQEALKSGRTNARGAK
jgi:hypothetical protein